MKVLVRVDASMASGAGHVMRQLALASALRDAGAAIEFVCRESDGIASTLVAAQSFPLHTLAFRNGITEDEDAAATGRAAGKIFDWVIVDQYELAAAWERAARAFGRRMLAVDDLADRVHDADLLVDQNYYAGLERRYEGLVSPHCECLLGPAYALLRSEFEEARRTLRGRNGTVRRILVSFGATDPAGQTAVALAALRSLNLEDVAIDVAQGRSDEMARLMAAADLALGAGGVSTNERMCMGLPAAVVATSPLQENSARDLAVIGAHRYLGSAKEMDADRYAKAVAELISDPASLRAMSDEGMRRVDGLGAQRVVSRMLDT